MLTIFVAALDVVYSRAASQRFQAQEQEVSEALKDAASQFRSGASEAMSFANMFGVGRVLGLGKSAAKPVASSSDAAAGFPGAAEAAGFGAGGTSSGQSKAAGSDFSPQWPQD